jgi:hypothetical protein
MLERKRGRQYKPGAVKPLYSAKPYGAVCNLRVANPKFIDEKRLNMRFALSLKVDRARPREMKLQVQCRRLLARARNQ